MTGEIKCRIGNLPREEWTDAAREVFAYWGEPGAWENGSKTNMSMVLANHPPLANAYHTFGRHLLLASTIKVRPRELIVLRAAWHQKCEYEWHYHVGYALAAGLTLEEIAAIRDGWQSPVWDDQDEAISEDRAVLRAVDELIETSRMSDAAYDALAKHFGKEQMMDLVFTIGNYVMLGWAVATFGIPVEDGVDPIGFDLKRRSGGPIESTARPFERD